VDWLHPSWQEMWTTRQCSKKLIYTIYVKLAHQSWPSHHSARQQRSHALSHAQPLTGGTHPLEGPTAQCHLVHGAAEGWDLVEPHCPAPVCTRIIVHWPPVPYKGVVLALAATPFALALATTSP
jgi:hypothetical protein